ncbi:MAG: bifunctional phosphopantothenoylcysteine decarboxylase/phosphopantothenate--cysteine ligase CoaBC [Deltaproteobacteria bacterium]|nr:bifunctional phosphopantothenoylcysteine decarboxylase/phosphopantothenate--cysteine ligase CoaBC [Deltaproteobacteria bacterium]
MLKGKTIVLGVTGGIAAYKSCDLVRRLRDADADVFVMMTRAAQEFVTPLTFQTLSGHPVQTNLFNLTEEYGINHISLADKADLIVIAPATADILAKIACGLCDDMVTTVVCATKAPVLLSPSMNLHMWENSVTRENIKKLKRLAYLIMEPEEGSLACGYEGKGRLPEPEAILQEVIKILKASKKVSFSE